MSATLVSTNQHKSEWVNTSQQESDTNQDQYDTSQHKSKTSLDHEK